MKVYLVEALTPKQKHEVNMWDRPHHRFSDHAFDSPTAMRTYVELEHPQDSVHKSHVEDHLAKHGYKIHDYHAGLAIDKHKRIVKIGKALGKTGGEHLLDGFTGDPARQQEKAKNDHMVVISRHPYDVAGMTSSGHSWEQESCMNFSDGSNKGYLPNDVAHGTHVAYLIHKDDKEIERPLARIALKPYHGHSIEDHLNNKGWSEAEEDPSHPDRVGNTILRPETRTYGDAPDAFEYTVNRWTNKHFPGHHEVYRKNEYVYDDTGRSTILSDNGVGKAARSSSGYLRTLAAMSPNLSEDDAMRLAKSDHGSYHTPLAKNPGISKKVAEHIWMGDRASYAAPNLLSHPKHGAHFIDRVLSYEPHSPESAWIPNAMASPQLTHKHIDKLMARPDFGKFKEALVEHHIHKASGPQVAKLLDSYKDASPMTQHHYARRLLNNKKTNVVVKHLLDGFKEGKEGYDNPLTIGKALIHPKSTLADYRATMAHARSTDPHQENNILRSMVETSMKDTPHRDEVLHDALDPRHGYALNGEAAKHAGITTSHIDKILAHPDSNIHRFAFSNENVGKTTEAHHLKFLDDHKLQLAMDDDDIGNVVSHMRGEALDRAVNYSTERANLSSKGNIKSHVISNPHLNIRHLDQLVNNANPDIQWEVRTLARHSGITPYHFDTLFGKMHSDSQAKMLDHPHIAAHHVAKLADHLTSGAADPDHYVDRESGSHVFMHPLVTDAHKLKLAKMGMLVLNHTELGQKTEEHLKPHHFDALSPINKSQVSFRWRKANDR